MPIQRKDCRSQRSVQEVEVISEDLTYPNSGIKERRHPKSLKFGSLREKEIKVVKSIAKEVSGKAFQAELNKFQPSNGLQERKIHCMQDKVALKFSSPLSDITSFSYLKKWMCEDMVSGDDADKQDGPSVVAVKLNWRKGVKVEQVSKFSRQTRLIEPEMTTTDFDFESKLKFQKQLQTEISNLLPNNDVRVLDGNDCHGRTGFKSKDVQPEFNPEDEFSNKVYEDKEEHKVLLIPIHTKTGFDTDVSKRYSFPYSARFTINKKAFEHEFQLRITPSQAPQHFGLIFTFPLPDQPTVKIVVKSLLSVFSVFPSTTRHAFLVTYANDNDSETARSSEQQKKPSGYRVKFVNNLKDSVSANLNETKLVNGSAFGHWDRTDEFSIGTTISHPHQRFLGIQPKFSDDRKDSKRKEKAKLAQFIQQDVVES